MDADRKNELINEIVELANRIKKLRHLVKPTPYQIRKEKKRKEEDEKHWVDKHKDGMA